MQVESGTYSKLALDTSDEVLNLTFTPAVFMAIAQCPGQDGIIGECYWSGGPANEQSASGFLDRHGVDSSDTWATAAPTFIALGDSVDKIRATVAVAGSQVTISTSLADFAVDVYWWAIDADAALGSFVGSSPTNASTTWAAEHQEGAPFVPDIGAALIACQQTFSADAVASSAIIAAALGNVSLGYFTAQYSAQNARSTMQGHGDVYDSTEGGYVSDVRNWNLLDRVGGSLITSMTALGSVNDTLDMEPIFGGVSSNRRRFAHGLSARNASSVTCGRDQVPATDSTLSITGLGFQPQFIFAQAIVGRETLKLDDIGSPLLRPGGFCVGMYDATQEHSFGNVQSGVDLSVINRTDTAALLSFPSPFGGSGTATPTADGFDIAFTGLDGTQHQFIWFAFGEAGGPPPFIADGDLVAEEAALSGAAILPVSALGAFVAEDAAMTGASNWTAPDFTAVGSFSAGESSLDGTAAVSEPVFDSSGDFQVSPALLSGLAEAISAPGTFAGSGAFVSEAAGLEGTAGFTPQDIVSSGAFTAELAILNGAASTFEEAVFPAAGAFSAELAQLAGSAITANTLIADGGFVCELASLRGATFLNPTDELGIVIGSIATRPSLRAEVNVNDTG